MMKCYLNPTQDNTSFQVFILISERKEVFELATSSQTLPTSGKNLGFKQQ